MLLDGEGVAGRLRRRRHDGAEAGGEELGDLELLRKVEVGLAALWSVRSETDVRARVAALNTEIAKVNSRVVEGPPTHLASLDVDEMVSEWRARRMRSS